MTTSAPGEVPWFLPGLAVTILISGFASRGVGHRLRIHPVHAAVILISLGAIVAATLTPLRGFPNLGATPIPCDLSRLGFAPIRDLFWLNNSSLNILLFAPLGAALTFAPLKSWRLLGAAAMLPLIIEAVQLLAPPLARGCESADVTDNLTGLVLGAAFGWLSNALARSAPTRRR